jgi:hypothetical protein
MSFLTEIETEFGVIKINVNTVIGKVISGIELVASEADALLNWAISQSATIQADLTAATPIISAVTGLLTTAATGNPALGVAAADAVSGINVAVTAAETAVKALNAANAALTASKAAGNGKVVNDTQAVMAGIQSVIGASQTVANVKSVALAAAVTIQAAINATPAAPVPASVVQ